MRPQALVYLVLVVMSCCHMVWSNAASVKHAEAKIVGLKWMHFGGQKATTDAMIREARFANSVRNFVTHGDNTPIEDFPYQAAILIDFQNHLYFLCGGVIVGRRKVITAAHCTQYMEEYDHYVAVGVYDLSLGMANPGSQMVKVKKFKNHHRYVEDITLGVPNDIAMLTLLTHLTYNSVVQRASLANSNQDKAGRDCVVSGYGFNEDFDLPNILQSGYQVSLSRKVCRKLWNIYPLARVNKRHICSMFYPIAACSGDSGGPLTCGNKVVGLTSWGDGECEGCLPVIFTRVSRFRAWIQRNS